MNSLLRVSGKSASDGMLLARYSGRQDPESGQHVPPLTTPPRLADNSPPPELSPLT
jgi:hypothetical protein